MFRTDTRVVGVNLDNVAKKVTESRDRLLAAAKYERVKL